MCQNENEALSDEQTVVVDALVERHGFDVMPCVCYHGFDVKPCVCYHGVQFIPSICDMKQEQIEQVLDRFDARQELPEGSVIIEEGQEVRVWEMMMGRIRVNEVWTLCMTCSRGQQGVELVGHASRLSVDDCVLHISPSPFFPCYKLHETN